MTKRQWIGVLAALLLPTHTAIAQRASDDGFGRTNASRLLGMDRTNVLVVLGLGAAAVAATQLTSAEGIVRVTDRAPLDAGVDVGDRYGDGMTLGLTALGLAALGQAVDSPRLVRLGEGMGGAITSSAAMTWALKLAIQERRPNGGAFSFPSGHTATAFAVAPVIERELGTAAGVAAYAVATLTALGRIEERKHHLQDVLAGAAIGIVAGRSFSSLAGLRIALAREGTETHVGWLTRF